MTPEQVRELAATVRFGMPNGPQLDALFALTDELLRHLGAPRVPTKISKARLAEIEAWCRRQPGGRCTLAPGSDVLWETGLSRARGWYRYYNRFMTYDRIDCHGNGPYLTLRNALEAPVVRRAGCPKVQEFEVEK